MLAAQNVALSERAGDLEERLGAVALRWPRGAPWRGDWSAICRNRRLVSCCRSTASRRRCSRTTLAGGIRSGDPACAGYVTFTTLAAWVALSRTAPGDGAPRVSWPGAGEVNGCGPQTGDTRGVAQPKVRVPQPLVRAGAAGPGARGCRGVRVDWDQRGLGPRAAKRAEQGCPASGASTAVGPGHRGQRRRPGRLHV
jgi:hypothetical protein